MKLSIAMPSHNVGMAINVNILNACTMASDDVEVVIRDNSGNAEKREFLTHVKPEKNCRILSVDECSGLENNYSLLKETSADFLFVICDDDLTNRYAIPTIIEHIERIKNDPSAIGTTGFYIMDYETQSHLVPFSNLEEPTALGRFEAFLGKGYPSIFQYSPLRRSTLEAVWGYTSSLPVFVSYHDWLMNCMYLMHGRLTYTGRFLYHYYNCNWATPLQCLQSDAGYYRAAGLDTSAVRIQWLIAAFEGAQTFMGKYQGIQMPTTERIGLATYWFKHMFSSFVHGCMSRQAPDAKFDAQALLLAEKWRVANDVELPKILTDIAEFYALSSPDIAQRYYNFWR